MKSPSLEDNVRFIRSEDIVINLAYVTAVTRTRNNDGSIVTEIRLLNDETPYRFPGEEGDRLWKFLRAYSIDIAREER